MKKYDDASWHYGAEDFPKRLPQSAGATYAGMYVAWILLNELCSEELETELAVQNEALRRRRLSPGQYFFDWLDGKLVEDNLSEIGNEFTAAYFDISSNIYSTDFFDLLSPEDEEDLSLDDLLSPHFVADTWENYDVIAERITERFRTWKKENSK